MSSIFTVHRQPYGEVMNPISPDSVRFHDKNGNVTEVRMVDGMVNIHVGGVTVSAEHLEDLIRQMFGRGEHPPAEAHCATCDCVPGMTPAIRFDTTPAEREGEVRDHLIRMGWTPPAEAQPADDPGEFGVGIQPNPKARYWQERAEFWRAQAVALGWREKRDTENGEAPPPSAPVGVEAALRDALQGLIDFIEIDNLPMDADAMFIAKRALAQQPAADSRICRVCDGGPGNDGSCLCGHRKWEQPAAVDSEMVKRAVNAYDEATGEGWQMPCLQGMRAALTAALAAQQGGTQE